MAFSECRVSSVGRETLKLYSHVTADIRYHHKTQQLAYVLGNHTQYTETIH